MTTDTLTLSRLDKKCNKCRRTLDVVNFHKDSTKPDGLYTICKDCRSGKTTIVEVADGYRQCRICDKVLPLSQYYNANRLTCIDCCEKRWNKSYKSKPGRFPANFQQSLLGYLSKSEQKAILRSNPEFRKKTRAADTKYKSSPKGKQKVKEWWGKNPSKRAKYNQTRKAKIYGLLDNFSEDDWREILDIFEHKCAYCQKSVSKLEQEHWIPVCRGGHYTRGNIIPSCQHCNRSKREKLPQDFCSTSDYLRISNIIKGLVNDNL